MQPLPEHDQETDGLDRGLNDPLLGAAMQEASARHDERTGRENDRQFIENPDSDEALFRSYQQGDHAAFLKIYERYKSGIFAYCARALYSAGMDRGQVDDTFQEVFMRVTQYGHTFVGGDFRAWVFTITRHTCLIMKKKFIQQVATTERVGDGEFFEEDVRADVRRAFTSTDDPLERMSIAERNGLLHQAIAALPETYREALILSEYEGMTYEEIGKATGTSLSTIRIRIFRAKAKLRKTLLPIIEQ